MEGWISIYRKLLDNPIVCKDADYLAVWIYLLLNATHREVDKMFKGKKITLVPGQLITGRKVIADKFKISESKVKRILIEFETDQQIVRERSNRSSLISIINWDKYQQIDQQDDQQMTSNRPASDQQVTTNNNEIINNVNNEINNKESKKERKKEKQKTFNELIDDYTTNDELREELRNHLATRKTKKATLTNRAIELSLQKLNELVKSVPVNDQEGMKLKIVRQSIEKGWTGFFPIQQSYYSNNNSNTSKSTSNNPFLNVLRNKGDTR